MSIINRKISIKCQTPKHLTKFNLLSLLPESESSKLVVMFVMVMIINVVVMVIMVIRTDKKTRKTRTNRTERGQIDLTFKLDFPGNL